MTGAVARRRGLLALTVTGVLWGTIGVVVRLLEDRGDATVAVAFWRYVCACVVLAPVVGRAGARGLMRALRSPGRLVAVTVGSATFQVLYFFAVRDVGVAVATLIALGLGPVVLTATDAVRARALPGPRTLAVLVTALTGLVLVSVVGPPTGSVAPRPGWGVAEAVLSALAYAGSTAWSGRLTSRLPPLSITFATAVVGSVALAPFVVAAGFPLPTSEASLAGTLWLGVVTTAVAYGLFYVGLATTPGSTAMVLTLLEPATAVFAAALVVHEPLTTVDVVGGALLLVAVAALYLDG